MHQRGFAHILLVSLILAISIGVISLLFFTNKTNLSPANTPETTSSTDGTVSYTGTITDNDTSCNHDGVCKVLVGRYWVVTNLGGDPTPEMAKQRGARGKVFLIDGTQSGTLGGDEIIGLKAEVFATKTSEDELSLYGSEEYFIKLLSE